MHTPARVTSASPWRSPSARVYEPDPPPTFCVAGKSILRATGNADLPRVSEASKRNAGQVAPLIGRRRRMRFNIARPVVKKAERGGGGGGRSPLVPVAVSAGYTYVVVAGGDPVHSPLVVSLTNVWSIPWARLHLSAWVHRHPLTRAIEPLSGEPCGTLIRRSGSPSSCDTRAAFNYGMTDIVACQFVNYSRVVAGTVERYVP